MKATRLLLGVFVLCAGPACDAAIVHVPGTASGLFGEPPSGAETDLVPAVRLLAGQSVTISATGTVNLGLNLLASPDGLDVARTIIEGPFPQGYTPLEEAAVDAGTAYADLPETIPQVGALMGAFVDAATVARPDFRAVDADRWDGAGIDPSELFLVGGGSFRFTAPADGTLFLGINEPYTGQNTGAFAADVVVIPLPPGAHGGIVGLIAIVVAPLLSRRRPA